MTERSQPYKGDQWEWSILQATDMDEYYIRQRHLSGAWRPRLLGPFSGRDMDAILTVVANVRRPDLMGIDGEMICHATVP